MKNIYNKITFTTLLLLMVSFQVVNAGGNSWDLNTAGDYAVSDATKVEVADGVGRLIKDSGNYPTDDDLTIIPQNSLTFQDTIDSFSVTATTSGNSSLNYYVSSDNGTTWKCWDSNVLAWQVHTDDPTTDMCMNGPSTESEINDNISTLDTDGGEFLWKAFLKSYPPVGDDGTTPNNGIDTPELNQVDITYDNTAPVIGGGDTASISINENTTTVTTVTATDDPAQSLTYSISEMAADDEKLFLMMLIQEC